ncbi:MAG: type II secretion system F family protein [Candidatus Magasanikbacteria bacterium]|nr:type II secretion system F family protein [Candidatus Magasanikbacteria bacterium]
MPPTDNPPRPKLTQRLRERYTPIRFREKIIFVYNLYIMIRAGLSIVAALKILSEQVENPRLRRIVGEVKAQVEKGRQLSEVLAEFPKLFPPVYVSMIAAGEAAGKMETALSQVASQMKKTQELKSRVRGTLVYPAVVLTAMVGIGLEMVFFVLPKIIVMFEDFQVGLPLPTLILISVVRGGQRYGVFILLLLSALIALAIVTFRRPGPRQTLHAVWLRLPIVGSINTKLGLARFTLTLSSLLESAIPIIEAVKISASVQNNLIFRGALIAAAEQLKKGVTLSAILAEKPRLFPPLVTQMLLVGEESGQVETMLRELAEYYANEVDTTMKNLSTVIEPAVILLLGFGVAGVAVAVIMPLYTLAQSF